MATRPGQLSRSRWSFTTDDSLTTPRFVHSTSWLRQVRKDPESSGLVSVRWDAEAEVVSVSALPLEGPQLRTGKLVVLEYRNRNDKLPAVL